MTLATIATPAAPLLLPNPVEAVIVDMDGTLLETEAVHLAAFAEVGAAMGWPMAQDVLLSMVGVHRDANHAMLLRRFGPDFPIERFYAESDALFEAAVEAGIPLRPGAQALLDFLADAGVPMAVATSTAAPFAQERLLKCGVADYFDVVVTRSDVTSPKPHPEPYLLAVTRLGADPARVLAVEDSYTGVESAAAAGLATVMTPDLLPPTDRQRAICAAILPSLVELRELLMGR